MKISGPFFLEASSKALLSVIPVVGGPLGSLISDFLAERKQQRLDEFLTQLKTDLDGLAGRINGDFINKADFLDIFELSAKKVMDERNEAKRIVYKDILVNGIIYREANYDDMEQCVRLIESLTEANIYMLKILEDPEKHNQSLPNPLIKPTSHISSASIERTLSHFLPTWPSEIILENLRDLEFMGLLNPLSSQARDMNTGYGIVLVSNRLTSKGKRLVKYIIKSI